MACCSSRDRPITPDRWRAVLVGLCAVPIAFFVLVPARALGVGGAGAVWSLAAAGAATLAGLASGWWMASRLRPGQWRLDAAGVAWHPQDAPVILLSWAEVARVRWWPNLFTLKGPTGRVERVEVDFRPDDWRAVRARVEAGLAPRFDLVGRRPCDEFRLGRVLLFITPIGLAAAWFALALPTPTIPQLHHSASAMMALLLIPLLATGLRTRIDRDRFHPARRLPRRSDQARSSR